MGGMMKLKAHYENGTLYDRIFQLESRFSQNGYKGNMDASVPADFREGSNSVLITAPHTVTHIRDGEVKLSEPYTGALALLMNEYSGAHTLYALKETRDPNQYNDTYFKEEMSRVIRKYNISLVIDLHGAASHRPFDVDIGTSHGTLAGAGDVSRLKDSLAKYDYHRTYENHTFTASDASHVANYAVNERGVTAMQVELNRSMRDPRHNFEAFYRTLLAFADYLD
ncbi:N-formylglutamate amidohydrolase [Alteribacter natronophilus]|uniref:N-formylglutamate amidohydrolase n=1 Tax=Alteribacter natronophilus TaxID=2583810 RepID=UPI00110E9280|nr:N-formylglutamate amidohydrolase [Alteribacter natronophilus]TMW72343.1 N-formylglutamate amidohydrolase [Alteribacter natronophilus]